jgi:alpha-glucosidase
MCTVNAGEGPVTIPAPGGLLLASGELGAEADGSVTLPPDTTAWWAV